jgi:rubrerythrin
MTTLVGMQTDLNSLLKNLVELDFDAIQAYDAAIARLKSPVYQNRLAAFREDHVRHTEELSRVLRDCGCAPPKGPDIKRVLTEGKVRLAGLVGDRAILFAMKTNETDTNVAYERATRSGTVTPQLRDILRDCLLDERRHRAWLIAQISGEEPPYAGSGGPTV